MNLKLERDPEIRGVLRSGNKKFFPIGWLYKQAYCEFQIYLESVKKIKLPPNEEMLRGGKIHQELEREHQEKAELELSIPEALKLSKEKKIYLRFREVKVYGKESGIYGVIDELLLGPDEVVILDDKPGSKAWLSNIMQVRGYCLAFQEEFSYSRPTIARLRNRDTKKIFWEELFSLTSKMKILRAIQHIHSLLNKEIEFKPSDNENKCKYCRFRIVCQEFKVR